MGIVLFAIIGATIKAGVGYWIMFSLYTLWKLALLVISLKNYKKGV